MKSEKGFNAIQIWIAVFLKNVAKSTSKESVAKNVLSANGTLKLSIPLPRFTSSQNRMLY